MLTPPRFDSREEFRRRFHPDAVPQRREEVAAVVGDDHSRAGRPRDLGDVGVVNPASRGIVLGGCLQQRVVTSPRASSLTDANGFRATMDCAE